MKRTLKALRSIFSGYFIVSLVLAVTFFCGISQMYLSNLSNLTFSYKVIIIIFLPLVLIFLIIWNFIITRIPLKQSRVLAIITLALSACLYFEGVFMPMDYGVFDGAQINWSHYFLRGFFDLAVWCGIFIFLFFAANKITVRHIRIGKLILIAFCCFQVSLIGFDIIKNRNVIFESRYVITDNKKFHLSEEHNILFIIIDAADNRMFETIIQNDPEIKALFNGFVYYDNVTTVSNYTERALPYMLTNQVYLNDQGFSEYKKNAFTTVPIFDLLKEQGYDNRIFTYSYMLPLTDFAQSNSIDNIANSAKVSLSDMMLIGRGLAQFYLTKYSPVLLKQFVWMDGTEFLPFQEAKYANMTSNEPINRDIQFYRQLKGTSPVNVEKTNSKAFRLYHLRGAHSPYDMDENMNPADLPYPQSIVAQVEGSLKVAAELIEQCKSMNIFDQTDIIIASDHGFGYNKSLGYYSCPLLLYKPAGVYDQDLQITHAPVTIGDISATILNAAGIDNHRDYGEALFDISENVVRRRYFYYNDANIPSKRMDFRSALYEFYTESNSRDMNSWVKTNTLYEPMEKSIVKTLDYRPGTDIISSKELRLDFFNRGVYIYDDRIYSAGNYSKLLINYSEVEKDIMMSYHLAPVFENAPQKVQVSVNGNILKDEIIVSNSDVKGNLIIPKKLISPMEETEIMLLYPNCQQVPLSEQFRSTMLASVELKTLSFSYV